MFVPMVEPPALVCHVESRHSDSEMHQAYQQFLMRHSKDSIKEGEKLRSKEYKRLDALQQIYLDYTGGSLYAISQLRYHLDLLKEGVFGNPHSYNPTSEISTQLIQKARDEVLRYFKASPAEYTVIFTSNATGALKLIGESYPFEAGSNYLLTVDNHNSVNGIREYATAKGAKTTYIPIFMPDLRADESKLDAFFALNTARGNHLFAFPAQSNFSGVQHPLEWISRAQEKGWDVLLDAAAFVPTNRLDLSKWHPDFIDLSFYKMFGYPTGIGCLMVKHTALAKLVRPWFSGGTIEYVSVHTIGHQLKSGYEGFEDGTVNYLGISAIANGLQYLESVGIESIHDRVMALTDWLINELLALRHSNGKPLITVYGPTTTKERGSTISFNFLDPEGTVVAGYYVEQEAKKVNISLRTGCFCNPGLLEVINGVSFANTAKKVVCYQSCLISDQLRCEQEISYGAVRVSLGIVSNFADAYHFITFAKSFIDRQAGSFDKTQLNRLLFVHNFGC